jgi:hypothetical protein
MNICSICKTTNDKYAIICKECGGYLQDRVPNLDLFSTLWKIMENPSGAFKLIVLAEHKNYAWFLYTLFGINIAFMELSLFQLGSKFENVLTLILWALIMGIPVGICLCPIISFLHWIMSKIAGGKGSFRISLGITSYSLIPMIISLILILPIKLLTFGIYLFTFNPHPLALKPAIYIILIGFDILLTIWSFMLFVVGTKVGDQISLWKSIPIIIIIYIAISEIMLLGGKYLPILFK